jgi:hypothetical protein
MIIPRAPERRPLSIEPLLRDPIQRRPRRIRRNISGDLKANAMGSKSGRSRTRTMAPKTPPNNEDMRAAPRARPP